ncbi:MAG: hyalin, partial [bacterium]
VLLNTTVFAAPAAVFFTDALTGPGNPNLTIPTAKYGYTASGLQRTQSDNFTDRPMVMTGANTFLTANNFTAEVTVTLANIDILYFGLGQGDMDPNYFNEPAHAFYFRVHSGWGNNSGIQADVRSIEPGGVFTVNEIGSYGLGSTITLRIVRAGDNVTMSIVGGGAVTYSLSAYPSLGLTPSNTRVFFGNTSVGSVFSNLNIYESLSDTTPPVIASPGNLTAEATGPNGAVVNFSATAQDNVDGLVNVTASPPSGSTFRLGLTLVSLSASDAAGNTATASFTIRVRDFSPPVISAPATVSAEATSADGAVVTFVATANDAVSGNVFVIANPPSGSTFGIGFVLVSLSATDAAGHTA